MKHQIKDKLADVSKRNWDTYRTIFDNDYTLFRDGIETVYAYVANRTVRQIIKDDIDVHNPEDLYRLDLIQIHSSTFKELFDRKRTSNGKMFRVSYSSLLSILINEGILHQNKSYSHNGKNKEGKKFSKSYCLTNKFVTEIANSDGFDDSKLYHSFMAYYPNRLLERIKVRVSKLLTEAKSLNYKEQIDFDERFLGRISTFGWYFDDDRMDVEQLERDLQTYIKHGEGKMVDYRLYDWFARCSSAFRSHLTIKGNHFREIYDFHAGMFWMLAIHGWKEGLISWDESENMIDHAFWGNFYADLAEQPKSDIVKLRFMQFANSHNGELIHLYKNENGNLIKTISNNFKKIYPQWWQMVKDRRDKFKGDVGKQNFLDATKIEMELFDRISTWLRSTGIKNVRRVHDAIYTTEDVQEIAVEVRAIVDKYCSDFLGK